ncbi:MAG: hypothetical protein ACP5GL_07405 [Infirmifilum sp.]|jgi:hypothetical protein
MDDFEAIKIAFNYILAMGKVAQVSGDELPEEYFRWRDQTRLILIYYMNSPITPLEVKRAIWKVLGIF